MHADSRSGRRYGSHAAGLAGFTIIELMLVMAVIGILVALAIPNLMNMQRRAKEASVRSNAHTVQLAAETFAARTGGRYPASPVDNQGFGTMVDLLPQGQLLQNPFTKVADSPVNGAAAATGVVGYQAQDLNGDGVFEGYLVTGFGDGDVVITLTSGQ